MSKATAIVDLAKRPATIMHVNPRPEFHGDSHVLAVDVKLDGIHLEPDELNLLLGDKHAHAALFKAANGKGKAAEPMFRQLKRFELVDKFENCTATIGLGLTDLEVELEDAKLAKVKLTPLVGGQTLMECTVQAVVEDSSDVASLLDYLLSEGTAALIIGAKAVPKDKKAQKDLDLAPTATKTADQAAGDDAGAVH